MPRPRETRGKLLAVALVILAVLQLAAAGTSSSKPASVSGVKSIALITTSDFRVAAVATRVGGGPPTAEVRVAVARRVGTNWRETGELRLNEAYFWRTVTGPRAICRLAIATAGARPSFRPTITLQLLLSPSLGCGRTYRYELPAR